MSESPDNIGKIAGKAFKAPDISGITAQAFKTPDISGIMAQVFKAPDISGERQFGDNHKVKLGKKHSKTNGVKLSKMASGLWLSRKRRVKPVWNGE